MKKQIHIGLAEDHIIVREGLVAMLKEYERIKVLFDVSNGQELMSKLTTHKPDIILLDIEMPVMNGSEVMERIKSKYPKIKVIIMTSFWQDSYIIEYVKKGAHSFLTKDCKMDELTKAIDAVYEKGSFFNERVAAVIAKELAEPWDKKSEREEGLSKQELEIIKLICENKTSREIASQMNLNLKTIEFHRSKILRKTNSKNVAALVQYAVQHSLIRIKK